MTPPHRDRGGLADWTSGTLARQGGMGATDLRIASSCAIIDGSRSDPRASVAGQTTGLPSRSRPQMFRSETRPPSTPARFVDARPRIRDGSEPMNQPNRSRSLGSNARVEGVKMLACLGAFSLLSSMVLAEPLCQPSSVAEEVFATPSRAAGEGGLIQVGSLLPRRPYSKVDPVAALLPRRMAELGFEIDPTRLPGSMVVKFRDELRVRAGVESSPVVASASGADVVPVIELLARYGASARQWLRKPEATLRELENRAAAAVGRAQPDLAGMVEILGVSPDDLFEFSRQINDLDIVEFVAIQRSPGNLQNCGTEAPADVSNCNRPRGLPGCDEQICCAQISGIDPACGDDLWDDTCAAQAMMLCNNGPAEGYRGVPANENVVLDYDPCFHDENGPGEVLTVFVQVYGTFQFQPCDQEHPERGCNNARCCWTVCWIDPHLL